MECMEDYKNSKDVASCQIEEPWKKVVFPPGRLPHCNLLQMEETYFPWTFLVHIYSEKNCYQPCTWKTVQIKLFTIAISILILFADKDAKSLNFILRPNWREAQFIGLFYQKYSLCRKPISLSKCMDMTQIPLHFTNVIYICTIPLCTLCGSRWHF